MSLQDRGNLLTSSPEPTPQEEEQITRDNGVVTTEDELEGCIVNLFAAQYKQPECRERRTESSVLFAWLIFC